MKLSLLTENLQAKLPFISKAVSLKSQLPVLSNILLKSEKGKLFISATDLEIGIQVQIPANIEEEGATTIPAKTFTELISTLPLGKITLETKDNILEVSTPKTKSTFPTIAEEEFPNLYEEKGEKLLDLKKEVLQKDFTSVIFAASLDGGRPALSGVYLKPEKKGFILVSTDGFRLSLKDFKIDSETPKIKKPLLIPARVLREIISLKNQEESVGVFVSEKNNQVLFQQGGDILVGRLIDAKYPDYEKIIPGNFTTSFTFDKEEVGKAVKICSIFARETANIIRFSIKKDLLVVSANTPQTGDNKVEVSVKLEGEENEIAFNAKYLLDLFSNVNMEEMVFETSGPLNPGVFKIKNDASFLHLIMPIRVQE